MPWDDGVLGRKTRWSMAAMGGLIVLGGLLVVGATMVGAQRRDLCEGLELIEMAWGLEAVVTGNEACRMGALNSIVICHPDCDLSRIAFPLPAAAVTLSAAGGGRRSLPQHRHRIVGSASRVGPVNHPAGRLCERYTVLSPTGAGGSGRALRPCSAGTPLRRPSACPLVSRAWGCRLLS